jgi:hypothetical protein
LGIEIIDAAPCKQCGADEIFADDLCQNCYHLERSFNKKVEEGNDMPKDVCKDCGEAPVHSRGLCGTCYSRWWRGDHVAKPVKKKVKKEVKRLPKKLPTPRQPVEDPEPDMREPTKAPQAPERKSAGTLIEIHSNVLALNQRLDRLEERLFG